MVIDGILYGPSPMRRMELVQQLIELKLISSSSEAMALLLGDTKPFESITRTVDKSRLHELGPGLRAKGGTFTEAGREPEHITVDLSGDWE